MSLHSHLCSFHNHTSVKTGRLLRRTDKIPDDQKCSSTSCLQLHRSWCLIDTEYILILCLYWCLHPRYELRSLVSCHVNTYLQNASYFVLSMITWVIPRQWFISCRAIQRTIVREYCKMLKTSSLEACRVPLRFKFAFEASCNKQFLNKKIHLYRHSSDIKISSTFEKKKKKKLRCILYSLFLVWTWGMRRVIFVLIATKIKRFLR